MTWKCPDCKLQLNPGYLFPVRCSCGLVDYGDGRIERYSRGLGDTVAKVIRKVTGGRIKPCGGCKKRQAMLNAMFPSRRTKESNRGNTL